MTSAWTFLNDSMLGKYSGSPCLYTAMPLGFCKIKRKSLSCLNFIESMLCKSISLKTFSKLLMVTDVHDTGDAREVLEEVEV